MTVEKINPAGLHAPQDNMYAPMNWEAWGDWPW